jgi:hypothetical protein
MILSVRSVVSEEVCMTQTVNKVGMISMPDHVDTGEMWRVAYEGGSGTYITGGCLLTCAFLSVFW